MSRTHRPSSRPTILPARKSGYGLMLVTLRFPNGLEVEGCGYGELAALANAYRRAKQQIQEGAET